MPKANWGHIYRAQTKWMTLIKEKVGMEQDVIFSPAMYTNIQTLFSACTDTAAGFVLQCYFVTLFSHFIMAEAKGLSIPQDESSSNFLTVLRCCQHLSTCSLHFVLAVWKCPWDPPTNILVLTMSSPLLILVKRQQCCYLPNPYLRFNLLSLP